MIYNKIICPTCGNTVIAKSIDEPQKCRWCRRLFKVNVTVRNKQGKKQKYNWSVEPVDFPENNKLRSRSLNDYMNEDIYGKPKR